MKRTFAIALGLLGWFALGLQLWLSIRMSLDRGAGVANGVWMYLAFFTILTNLVVALTLTMPLLDARLERVFARPGVISAVAAYIVVVAAAYNLLLRGLWNPRGWQLLADILLHDVIPGLYLIYWWMAVPRQSLHWRNLAAWCFYPIFYFVYAMARGALTGFYPYPFINVARFGYAHVLANACGLLLGFLAVGAALITLNRVRRARGLC